MPFLFNPCRPCCTPAAPTTIANIYIAWGTAFEDSSNHEISADFFDNYDIIYWGAGDHSWTTDLSAYDVIIVSMAYCYHIIVNNPTYYSNMVDKVSEHLLAGKKVIIPASPVGFTINAHTYANLFLGDLGSTMSFNNLVTGSPSFYNDVYWLTNFSGEAINASPLNTGITNSDFHLFYNGATSLVYIGAFRIDGGTTIWRADYDFFYVVGPNSYHLTGNDVPIWAVESVSGGQILCIGNRGGHTAARFSAFYYAISMAEGNRYVNNTGLLWGRINGNTSYL